ncbi:hypothetical protein [Myxococcus sp. RHSTA-1-4]|uniref:hypothetical protein n=1 Tax=Myxococcus sp. RHSTA-1-4 TaxID=2874601 RepID=UPI001CBB6653|nr:hypothetical protein [Myxococcus sp. RHSTA-1-4]MBZ4420776.1 hypothetical protein [Myxococcus sp. RHSTA-1-4]
MSQPLRQPVPPSTDARPSPHAVPSAPPPDVPGPLRWLFPASVRAERALDLGALLLLFAAVCGPYLRRVFESELPGGWDGVAHYGVAHLYAQRVFPAVSGWMPEYFAGMPFPNFYPPVFYFLVALGTKVGMSTTASFWTVQTLASAAVPLLSYECGRRLGGARVAGLVAGALAVGFLANNSPVRGLGITLHSTFDAGLSTQLLAHVFTLAFYAAFLEADRGRVPAVLSSVFLALVALTNVHVVWVAAFLFICLVVARLVQAPSWAARARVLGLHFAIGLGALLLSAVWVLPMLLKLKYVPTQALETPPPGAFIYAFLRLGAYLLFGTLAAFFKRDGRALALVATLGVMLVFTLLPTVEVLGLQSLAIQPGRIVVAFPFLMVFLVGYLVAVAGEVWRWPHARMAVGAACALVFFAHFKLEREPTGNIGPELAAEYQQVIDALGGRTDGRVLVEQGQAGLVDPFGLQVLVGAAGGHSLTTVFRESAINVFFANPLRNSFSTHQETFGIDGKLHAGEFDAAPLEAQVARLRLFNIQYLAAHSEGIKARLAAMPQVRRVSPPGRWELYAFRDAAPGTAVVPAYEPVLTFTSFSVKPRPDFGFDFVRLGEEAFRDARLDTPLVLSRAGALDAESDWERFQTALVTEYRYRDEEAAYAALERFSRTKHVVLLASADPLFERLEVLSRDRGTVHVVPTISPEEMKAIAGDLQLTDSTMTDKEALLYAQRLATREVAKGLFDALEKVRVPLKDAPSVTDSKVEGNTATVTLSAEPSRPVPLWVRQGYFPNWRSAEGEPVYLAFPTFQLTFTQRRDVTLSFVHDSVEWVSGALSLLGLLGVVAVLLGRRRAPGATAPVA